MEILAQGLKDLTVRITHSLFSAKGTLTGKQVGYLSEVSNTEGRGRGLNTTAPELLLEPAGAFHPCIWDDVVKTNRDLKDLLWILDAILCKSTVR